jgi:hypothetical protein
MNKREQVVFLRVIGILGFAFIMIAVIVQQCVV